MKACLLIVHSFQPPHSFTFSTARILHENGFEVTIIGVGDRRLPQAQMLGEVSLVRARNDGIYSSPFVSVLNPLTLLSLFLKSRWEKADIYCCHGYAMLPSICSKIIR